MNSNTIASYSSDAARMNFDVARMYGALNTRTFSLILKCAASRNDRSHGAMHESSMRDYINEKTSYC